MTRAEIEQAIDEHLDSIAFNEEGEGVMPDGRIATDADFKAALVEYRRLKNLLRRPLLTALRECTTPPSEPVEWEVEWVGWGHFPISGHSQGFINEKRTARTAFEAHRQVPQAPAFGSCRVRRVG